MKKFIIKNKSLVFVFMLLLLIGIGGSFAYYYSEVVIPNEFKAKTYNVTIEEVFNNTWGTKEVSFVNNESTNASVVLRFNYNEKWRKTENGVTNSLSNTIGGVSVVDKTWTSAFTNDFVKIGDWYYYKKVLNALERVQVLSSISKNTTLIASSGEPYDDYDYELDFNFEAIQASGEAISDIWGKTVTIEGSNVTWQ